MDEQRYFTLITEVGARKMAAAIQSGIACTIVEAAVGDGAGVYYRPMPQQLALRGEVWRGSIVSSELDPEALNMFRVRFIIPADVGGFTVREAGLFDAEGDLLAVCNLPDTQKAQYASGTVGKLTIVMHIMVADSGTVDFVIHPELDSVTPEQLTITVAAHDTDPHAHPGILAKLDTLLVHSVIGGREHSLTGLTAKSGIVLAQFFAVYPAYYALDTIQIDGVAFRAKAFSSDAPLCNGCFAKGELVSVVVDVDNKQVIFGEFGKASFSGFTAEHIALAPFVISSNIQQFITMGDRTLPSINVYYDIFKCAKYNTGMYLIFAQAGGTDRIRFHSTFLLTFGPGQVYPPVVTVLTGNTPSTDGTAHINIKGDRAGATIQARSPGSDYSGTIQITVIKGML